MTIFLIVKERQNKTKQKTFIKLDSNCFVSWPAGLKLLQYQNISSWTRTLSWTTLIKKTFFFRHNLLASLQRDSSVINLYDIQHTVVGTEEVEPSVLERVIVPGSPHNITSFSWHSSDENRLLAIALSGFNSVIPFLSIINEIQNFL